MSKAKSQRGSKKTKARAVKAPAVAKRAVDVNGPSLARIFEGTLSALSRHGAKQLSMTDVCDAAGISRATLYRYFSKKEALLAALGEYVTANFAAGVKAAAAEQTEAHEKLRAVLDFMIAYTRQIKSDRILEVEPEFVLKALHVQFPRHLAAIREALEPVFAEMEKRLGAPLDRDLLSELLLRSQESTTLVPSGAVWSRLPDFLAGFVQRYLDSGARGKVRVATSKVSSEHRVSARRA